MLIAHAGGGLAQQIGVDVHRFMMQDRTSRNWRFSLGVSPGSSRFFAGVGADGPVVVLAAAVDAGKGLLVQQTHQTVAVATRFMVSMVSWFWSTARLHMV